MKQIIAVVFLAAIQICHGQVVADFENFEIPRDTFLDGRDGSGGFSSGNVFLANDYSTDFASWTGWAISSTQNDTTPGFLNQYSAIAGQGVDSSSSYGVSFSFGPNIIQMEDGAVGKNVDGLYITNGTYPYLSMRDGDAFAKRFGGITGDDPDFFLLTIKKYSNGDLSTDSVNFYLADYRFADNSQDYLIDEWTFVDLTSLGPVDSLSLALSSSDVGMFGMNTPAYFCVDNIVTAGTSTTSKRQEKIEFGVHPNPSQEIIWMDGLDVGKFDFVVFDILGRPLMADKNISTQRQIQIGALQPGTYYIQIRKDQAVGLKQFIKH